MHYRISDKEMEELQSFAHELWKEDGAKIKFEFYKDKKDKRRVFPKQKFSGNDKQDMFIMSYYLRIPLKVIAEKYNTYIDRVRLIVHKIKVSKGIPITKNGKH